MSEFSLLDRCIIFVIQKHSGQLDKVGLPYILHPLRVMSDLSLETEEQRCIAVLHDVLEDTDATKVDLFWLTESREITESVVYLTHPRNEPNPKYWQRILEDPTGNARAVKLADIRDNMSPARMQGLPILDQERMMHKYQAALHVLNGGSNIV